MDATTTDRAVRRVTDLVFRLEGRTPGTVDPAEWGEQAARVREALTSVKDD